MRYFCYKKSLREIFRLLIESPSLRLDISLIFGIFMNSVYIISNFLSSLLYKSVWAATLTVYYLLFLTIRLYLLFTRGGEVRGDRRRVYKICLRVGIILFLLDFAVAAVMLRTARIDSFTPYSGILLLGFLIYTVYSVAASVYGMRHSSKNDMPITFAARNMTLAATLVSLYNLQYSVLTTLGASAELKKIANTVSGTVVFFTIIALSLRLIIKNAYYLYQRDT